MLNCVLTAIISDADILSKKVDKVLDNEHVVLKYVTHFAIVMLPYPVVDEEAAIYFLFAMPKVSLPEGMPKLANLVRRVSLRIFLS